MPRRIPHGASELEVRQAFQRLSEDSGILTEGTTGQILIGQGIGSAPVWTTDITALTSLTVDNITINAAIISSDTGAISFADENITTTGNMTAESFITGTLTVDAASITDSTGAISFGDENLSTTGTISGVNVTSGTDPGHTHSIYILVDGTRAFTGVVTGVYPTDPSHLATKEYVDSQVNFITEWFLNNTASDIGGIYYDMAIDSTGEAKSTFSVGPLTTGDDQPLVNFATPAGFPGVLVAENGVYTLHIHAAVTAGNKPTKIYFELYNRTAGPSESLLATSEESAYITTEAALRLHATVPEDVATLAADRLVIKLYANVEATGSDVTVALYAEGTTAARFETPTTTEILSNVFVRRDGTTSLTGNLSVDALVTIDGRDLSVDGSKLDGIEALADVTDATNVAAAGAAMAGGAFHDGFSDFVTNEHIDWTNATAALSTTNTITGVNVTSGVDPGHTHTSAGFGLESLTNGNALPVSICQVVYIDSADTFDLADATDDAAHRAIGLVADTSISASAAGNVRTVGILTATTGQWDAVTGGSGGLTAGTVYWLDQDTPGDITATKPTSPAANKVEVGIGVSTTDMLVIPRPPVVDGVDMITADLTLYVDTGGSDTTALGSAADPFATIDGALSFIAKKLIASDVTVTIQIADGVYTHTVRTDIAHPNGANIEIKAENTYTTTMTSIQSTSGVTGAWSIVCNVASVANIAVGDYVIAPIGMTGGNRPETMCGIHEVTNVDALNTRITVTSKSLYSSAPSGAVTGTLTILKVVLYYSGSNGLYFAPGAKLGLLEGVCLKGTASYYGLFLVAQNFCLMDTGKTGVTGWDYGAELNFGSTLKANTSAWSGNTRNIDNVGATLQAQNAVLTGATYGINANNLASCVINSSKITGCTNGVYAQMNSAVLWVSGYCGYNPTIGIYGNYNAIVYFTGGTFQTNGTNANPTVNTYNTQADAHIAQ